LRGIAVEIEITERAERQNHAKPDDDAPHPSRLALLRLMVAKRIVAGFDRQLVHAASTRYRR
jgi:hypothetical protein